MMRITDVSISDVQISSKAVRFEIDEAEPVIEIKAVTHHELEIGLQESEDGSIIGLRAKVILDV
jgi:SHS2 domain-containing protein